MYIYFGHVFKINMFKKNIKTSSNRNFGLTFASIFLIIGIYALFKNLDHKSYFLAASLIFFIITLIEPKILYPLNFLWSKLGIYLSIIATPIIIFVIFFCTVVPMGLLSKFFNYFKKNEDISLNKNSHWINSEEKEINLRDQF